jgi:hypothetical protein
MTKQSYCANCQAELRPEASFCLKCGASTRDSQSAAAPLESQPSNEEMEQQVQQTYEYIFEQLNSGATQQQIVGQLVENGWDEANADNIVGTAIQYWSGAQDSASREKAHRDLAWGVGLIVVGGGITAATYGAASAGGTYFVFLAPSFMEE